MFCEIVIAGKYETGNKTNQMTIVRMSVKTRKRQILNLKRFSKHRANMGMTTRRKKEWWVNFWIVHLRYCLNTSDCCG